MADKTEIKLNGSGFRQIMQGGPIQSLLSTSVQRMESAAESHGESGANYLSNVQIGKVSAHGMVATGDRRAAKSNAKHNTLRKCIDAGRV